MNRCIYTKEYFETADGEHILQNFLGARWTSTEISSNEVTSPRITEHFGLEISGFKVGKSELTRSQIA